MESNAKGDGNSRDSTNIWSAPVTAMVLWFEHWTSHTWQSPAPAFAGLALLWHEVCETEQGKKISSHPSQGHVTRIPHHDADTVHRHVHKWLPDSCCPVPERQAALSFLPKTSHFGISAGLLAAPDRRVSDVQGSIKWNSHLAFLSHECWTLHK